MMNSDDEYGEVHRLLFNASRLPHGVEQMECHEKAIRIAEKLSDDELIFDLHLSLAQSSFECGQLEKTIVAVARCFGMHDREPERFSYEALLDVCTYAISSLSSLPTSTRKQIADVLDNIEQRYKEAGYSLRTVYRARCFNAFWMGDGAEADRAYEQLNDCPLDFTYEGDSWDRLFRCDYLLHRGRVKEARAVAEPTLRAEGDSDGSYCWLASFILFPLVVLDEPDEAAAAQRRSIDEIKSNPNFAECVGHHILYFVAISELDEAVRLVDRCIAWALDAPLLRESFELALAGWACVRRLRNSGQDRWPGNLPASHAKVLGDHALEAMDARLETFVTESAARFDVRNGNEHYADLIRYRMAPAEIDWEPK